jgi:hypothetical protein
MYVCVCKEFDVDGDEIENEGPFEAEARADKPAEAAEPADTDGDAEAEMDTLLDATLLRLSLDEDDPPEAPTPPTDEAEEGRFGESDISPKFFDRSEFFPRTHAMPLLHLFDGGFFIMKRERGGSSCRFVRPFLAFLTPPKLLFYIYIHRNQLVKFKLG